MAGTAPGTKWRPLAVINALASRMPNHIENNLSAPSPVFKSADIFHQFADIGRYGSSSRRSTPLLNLIRAQGHLLKWNIPYTKRPSSSP
jgi:hypothetical protein